MTNFEWLRKGNQLEDFLYDCHFLTWGDICKKYKIDNTRYPGQTAIAVWLGEEYKATQWVYLQDVRDIFLDTLVQYNHTQETFTCEELIQTVNTNLQIILEDIESLPTKEIDS